jgi:hypothetical protein
MLSTHEKLLALGLALTVALFVVYVRATAPDQSVVNGTYFNECCGVVVLRDGKLFYKKAIYKYDLENMKFGLTAYVPGKFTEQGVVSSSDETALSFFANGGKRGFETMVSGREYSFLKAR